MNADIQAIVDHAKAVVERVRRDFNFNPADRLRAICMEDDDFVIAWYSAQHDATKYFRVTPDAIFKLNMKQFLGILEGEDAADLNHLKDQIAGGVA